MKTNLKNDFLYCFLKPNSYVRLSTKGTSITLSQNENHITIKSLGQNTTTDFSVSRGSSDNQKDIKAAVIALLDDLRGKEVYVMDSDVLAIFNEEVKLIDLSEEISLVIMAQMLGASINYLAQVSSDENEDIIIHNVYNPATKSLGITVGLDSDIQVSLLHIKIKEK